ncbi:TPA: hypothetical protein O5T86_001247 [Staphylococcus aureus]|nr:hypothetical protein [Staphylococcus aureus]HDA7217704.1 hypothetical protein [Staphylococcus aureus]HDA7234983.1 hypothetical protein [Staphylococcus aureus]HDA7236786.1 hypothetical protein [Staphylococcus aureus]HDA7239211.1 hypothetical protein [Staphylococcus aureus]
MANTITKTTIIDGIRNLVIMLNISGDGSGDETNTLIMDRSTFAPTDGTEIVIEKVAGNLNGFTAALSFDATTDLIFASCPATWFEYDWKCFGGVSSNKSGAGTNGDILLTTVGLGSGKKGTIMIEMKKS